jgi:hypothetical protein
MIKRIFALFLLLSAGTLFFNVPQPFQIISGILQAFLLPGLLFTFLVLNGKITRSDQFVLSLLLSPLLLALLAAVVNILTGDIYTSTRIVLAGCYLLFIITLILGRHNEVSDDRKGVPKKILALSFVFGGMVFLSYILNGYLLIRSDSWYHAAVIQEVVHRGIPPGEPLIAEYPIMYMWFYHLFQAIWIRLSGLSLFNAMAFFNIINALIYPYLIARFISYFTERKRVIVFATALAVVGLDAVSWILWPISLLRMFMGDVTGMAELKRILAGININGISVIYFLTPAGTWNINFSDKFLTITIFNYSLNLFLVTAIVSLKKSFLDDSRVRSAILLFVIILGVFLFHIVTGITLLFTVTGSGILMYLALRYIHGEKRKLKDFYALFISLFLVVLIAVPYFLSLVSGGSSDESSSLMTNLFHVGFTSILTILFPLAILFFPARDAFRKLLSGKDHTSRMLVLWIVCLLILNIFVNIGIVGEKKFIYFLFLIIGPPICVQIVEKLEKYSGIKRILLVAAVVVLFLVPPVLTFRGFIIETPGTAMGKRRNNITDEDIRFFDWIENNTSKDDVIVENNIYHLTPVYAGRRNLYSWYYVIPALGYGGENLELFKEIQTSIFGEGEVAPDIIDDMKEFDRKLYVAVWWEDIEANPWLVERFNSESKLFKEVYSSERVSLYTLNEGR